MAKKKNKKLNLLKTDTQKFIAFAILILLGFILGTNFNRLEKISLPRILPVRVAAGDEITAKELEKKLEDKNLTLINVHTPYEGEIKNTDTFIDYDSFYAQSDRLPKDKNAPIIVYCQSGNMSKEALNTLKDMGYTNVVHLKGGMKAWKAAGYEILDLSNLSEKVVPEKGKELPISFGNYLPRLIEIGVIDKDKYIDMVKPTDEEIEIMTKGTNNNIKVDAKESRFIVNMLWALGLAQKSIVYDEGPMGTEYKDRAGNFASTGGWQLAKGDAMNYLNKYSLIPLTEKQQRRVAEIAKNMYRPCCGNNTYFPDCNHGMAALAAIELMVSQNMSDEEIYDNLLVLNSYWFPSTYLTAATYYERQGTKWEDVDAKEVLGQKFSSAQGAGEIAKEVGPLPYSVKGGGSCGA